MNPMYHLIILLAILIVVEILIFNSIYLTPEDRHQEGWRLWVAIAVTVVIVLLGGVRWANTLYKQVGGSEVEYGWFNRNKKQQQQPPAQPKPGDRDPVSGGYYNQQGKVVQPGSDEWNAAIRRMRGQ